MKLQSTLVAFLAAAISFALIAPVLAFAQEGHEPDPAGALSAALAAACRANETMFANYLTADNAAAFHALPQEQRTAFLKRFSLSDDPGKPLISADQKNRTVLRCQTPRQTAEFRFGDARMHENLAFLPVTVVDGVQTEFGLVRENGGWRLLSLGLVLLDIPQLTKRWAESELAAREDTALDTLRNLADAIQSYRRAFGKLPESLAQLGPAPPNGVSPDQASLVDEHLAAGSEGGYQFRYRIVPAEKLADEKFELAAAPEDYGKTGRLSFFFDGEGKIHGADKHAATATAEDPLIPGEKTP
jgi:hypothetical protein